MDGQIGQDIIRQIQMGQSQQAHVQSHLKISQWRPQQKNLLHTLPHISILSSHDSVIAVPVLDLTSKSLQHMIDTYRYYTSRIKHTSSSSLKIRKIQMNDASGRDLTPTLESNMLSQSGRKQEKNGTTCSLNIFQGYCQRSIPDRVTFNGKMSIFVEYHQNNVEMQCQRRKEKGTCFSENEIVEMLGVVVKEGKQMVQNKWKEPLLSPKGIKIDKKGKYRVGEWEIAHFVEGGEGEEETGFVDQGETVLVIEGHKEEKDEEKKEFDMLGHYYWPPEGTTAMNSLTRIGTLPSPSPYPSKGQIFSLAMTALHLLLQRPLYQTQTYSQKTIQNYLQEAIIYRQQSKIPLSAELVTILRSMLMWNVKQRISYWELERQLEGILQRDTVRGEVQSGSRSSVRIPFSGSLRIPVTTSVRVNINSNPDRDADGSGSIDQGEGDQSHPKEEIPFQKTQNTMRVKTQEYSLDYHKIDYTIRRQRKEWQMFQNRLSTSQSHETSHNDMKNQLSLCLGSFPCELMAEDQEDQPNQQVLCLILPDNRKEKEVTDEEQEALGGASDFKQNQSQITDQIKLLDISNIKARQLSEKCLQKNRTNSNHKLFNQFLFQNEESFSTLLHGKNINVQAFMNESDSLLLKSSTSPKLFKEKTKIEVKRGQTEQEICDQHSGLFTSPELMALIRESADKPKQHSWRTSRKENKVSPGKNSNQSLSRSNFVKEQFAKGWYEGGKAQGLRNGYGTFHYNEGGKYCGDWLNSQMHGRGTLYYADGRIAYQGQWQCDSLNGQGILYNQTPKKMSAPFDYRNFDLSEDVWVYYQGIFANDDKNGKGVLLLTNGQKYDGTFKNDLVEGQGTFFCGNGQVIRGIWKGNRLVEVKSIESQGREESSLRASVKN